MPFRLLIVTSYRVFREALADVLDRETGLAVLGRPTNVSQRRGPTPELHRRETLKPVPATGTATGIWIGSGGPSVRSKRFGAERRTGSDCR